VSTQTVLVSNKKNKPKADREKYRKPFRPARIRMVLAVLAEEAAAENAEDFTHWINGAVRMRLESVGKWPPKR